MKIKKHGNLRYVDEGKGDAILFFHGWAVTPFSYLNSIKFLAKDFRVIAPFIDSFRKFKSITKDTEDLLKNLQIEKVLVIGHSAGGITAASFVANCNKSSSGLILINSAGIKTKKNVSIHMLKWLNYLRILVTRHIQHFSLMIMDFLRNLLFFKDLIDEAIFIRNYSFNDLSLNIPVFIIWGKDDHLISVNNAYELNKIFVGSKLEIVEGDHEWLAENPQLLVKKIKEFLEK